MSSIDRLKEANNLSDVARLLGFTPQGLSYVLYKLKDSQKYKEFQIPKKSGGFRTICAPQGHIKLLQKRLADLLTGCIEELRSKHAQFLSSSHGFEKKKTIISNAKMHKRKRFVFNIDIENFFGTINFGRVRGFFIKENSFTLNETVATIIAQIACHKNSLPQGSPASPVISNLIGNILDRRVAELAILYKCSYTRYADDITFSTNEVQFPPEIAENIHGNTWVVGWTLRSEITNAGFLINDKKTRMSLRRSRQTVTGIVVNKKININQQYYRMARAMCHSVFTKGFYSKKLSGNEVKFNSLNSLNGILSHIHFVKSRLDRPFKVNKEAESAGEFKDPAAPKNLFKRFLFYKYFVSPTAPILIPEGVTDITYIQCAIRALGMSFPSLAENKNGKHTRLINFLKPSRVTREVLNLGFGTSGQTTLISSYSNMLKSFHHRPLKFPVIIICDNDSGLKPIFGAAKGKNGTIISVTTTEPFYHLGENLYLVKVPENTPPGDRAIEDLFDASTLAWKLDGKTFDPKKERGDDKSYGKVVFAEKVVQPNQHTINFANFTELLARIEQCITHYAALIAAPAAAAGPAIKVASSAPPAPATPTV